MKNNDLIIEIPFERLGDHLFHSHLPRIAKESGKKNKVYLSNYSNFGHSDYKKLIWELNPYIDGFVDEPGEKCDVSILVEKVNRDSKHNLLDEVMFFYKLDNGLVWNQPELYYKPIYKPEYDALIYDPNHMSWIGNVTDEDAMIFFKKQNIKFDKIMKLRGNKVLYIPDNKTKYLETPTLSDFCNLIFSAKQLYCLTSGTATLASALGKTAVVFYGDQQPEGFQHYQKHKYVLIPKTLYGSIRRQIKSVLNIRK